MLKRLILPLLWVYVCSVIINLYILPKFSSPSAKVTAVAVVDGKILIDDEGHHFSNLLQLTDRSTLLPNNTPAVLQKPFSFMCLFKAGICRFSIKNRVFCSKPSRKLSYILLRAIRI